MKLSIDNLLSSDVKKPTALVHFERDMSPTEQKLMTLLIFHCQLAKKNEKGFYYIKKSFVRKFLGWDDSNNYPRIYEYFESIFNNSIKWNLLGLDRTFKSLKCKMIVSLLEPTETGQYIGFQLHPQLEPIIRDPKVFAKIKLIMMSILAKPKYAFPLYEIFSDYYSRGEKTVTISLYDLRHLLGIKGPYYEDFVHFKKEILRLNLEAINKNTDYKVNYQTYRDGRKIGGLSFTIEKQRWQPPLLVDHLKELGNYYDNKALNLPLLANPRAVSEEQHFIESVAKYHISDVDARKFIKAHGSEGAIEIRDYVLSEVERRKRGKNPVRDVGAYMARCLREGFGKKTAEEREQEVWKKAEKESKHKLEESRKQILVKVDDVRKNFWSYQTKLIDDLMEKMSVEEKENLEKSFVVNNPIWAKQFKKMGINSPLVRSAFYTFVATELLTDEQRDIIMFAKSNGFPSEVINQLNEGIG